MIKTSLTKILVLSAAVASFAFTGSALAGPDEKTTERDLSANFSKPGEDSDYEPEYKENGPKITIRPTRGKQVSEGDQVRFDIKANRDGFGHLYVLSASGRVQLWMENVPLDANRTIKYPDPDSNFTIEASGPEGKDKVIALLTRYRLNGFSGRRTVESPRDLDMDVDEFRDELKGILSKIDRTDWQWALTFVEVVE